MTTEEQMKAIVESVDGGCWHDIAGWQEINGSLQRCSKCNAPSNKGKNPSPTDMNVLMEYAEKLGYQDIRVNKLGSFWGTTLRSIYRDGPKDIEVKSSFSGHEIQADALREALYQAVKGEG